MLNLLWYVARFDLRMDVLCHHAGDGVYLYAHNSDTVMKLQPDDAKDWLRKENTVYLFDPNEANTLPLYHESYIATSVIATSPDVRHYMNISKGVGSYSKDANVIDLWSYAWTYEEIDEGLRLLGKKPLKELPEVDKVVKLFAGSFRVALKAEHASDFKNRASGVSTFLGAEQALEQVMSSVDQRVFDQLRYVNTREGLADKMYSGDASFFKLSHYIVTSRTDPKMPEPKTALPQWIDKCKVATTKQDIEKMTAEMLVNAKYLSSCGLEWTSDEAAEAFFKRLCEFGYFSQLLNLIFVLPGSTKGGIFEALLLRMEHPEPYVLRDASNKVTRPPINMSYLRRYPESQKLRNINVTTFEGNDAPYLLVADSLHNLQSSSGDVREDADPAALARLTWRLDALSQNHPDFDSYLIDHPHGFIKNTSPGEKIKKPRLVLFQFTIGKEHSFFPGRVFRKVQEFKRSLGKTLGLPKGDEIDVDIVFMSTHAYVKLEVSKREKVLTE